MSRKMFEVVNEVMERRDEGKLRVCYEDEEMIYNTSTYAHTNDTEMSIDASKEWSEADKEKIESWRSSEKVTERIIRGQ